MKNVNNKQITFRGLVNSIRDINSQFAAGAGRAVNVSLTLRNWLIGYHIEVFELHGADRAKYGERLLSVLSNELQYQNISNTGKRQLYNYLSFYKTYPQIVRTLPALFKNLSLPQLTFPKVRTVSAQLAVPAEKLISNLSYHHLELLVELEDHLKRTFYEVECLKGSWSVRELKRQIATLYYERSGLSKNKNKLSKLVHRKAENVSRSLNIRDPYIFEFLGIKSKEVMGESHLEDALLERLQEFLLELGHGFCFEARQKRVLIGNKHYFIDLVFYHRILKCHFLIELKTDEFSHEHLGQLNTYVGWYKKNMMQKEDNPPIGLLLCTKRDHFLIEYALSGMDNTLFVSRYQVELPKKEEIRKFMEGQMGKINSTSLQSIKIK